VGLSGWLVFGQSRLGREPLSNDLIGCLALQHTKVDTSGSYAPLHRGSATDETTIDSRCTHNCGGASGTAIPIRRPARLLALLWQFWTMFCRISIGYELHSGKAKRKPHQRKRKNCQGSARRETVQRPAAATRARAATSPQWSASRRCRTDRFLACTQASQKHRCATEPLAPTGRPSAWRSSLVAAPGTVYSEQ
jgi:hypothetical protein